MQTILFFDLDETLILNEFSRKVVGPLLREISDASGGSIELIARAYSAENIRRQKEDPDNVLTMDWDDIMEAIAGQYDVTLSDSVDNRWQEIANLDDIEILDDAPVVLKLLQHPQRKIVLSTKGLMKYQLPILEMTGLKKLFDDILTPDVTGYLKTSPAYFERYQANDALKIQIGDHYYDDVICAKQKDFYSVMRVPLEELEVYDPFDRPQKLVDFHEQIHTYQGEGTDILPDAVVVSLKELPDVIKRIENQL